jgi:hypothetical protein
LDRDLKDRGNPPLPARVMAPFAAFSGTSALPPRIPFALCGMACVGLLLWWLRRDKADRLTWLLMALAILGNVSLFLYFRQARYYGLTLLCSVAIASCYLHWNGSRRALLWLSLLFLAVLACHYITFAGLAAVLAADYLIWQRHHVRKLKPVDWLLLLVPTVVFGSIIVFIWNPFLLPGIVKQTSSNNIWDRLALFFWDLRDLDRAEFGVGVLLLLAPVLYFAVERTQILLRGPVCILIYCLVMAIVSPQPVHVTSVADVRYLIPLIPLCMAVEVAVLRLIACRAALWMGVSSFRVGVSLGVVAFGTNMLNGGPFFPEGARSTIVAFSRELLSPPSDPYTEAARWVNQHVPENVSIWALPDYTAYPLIYHAPKAVYAWQLTWPPEAQFRGLPLINFRGQEPLDYIICFGPPALRLSGPFQTWAQHGISYAHVATLDFFWANVYRPELFWHTFTPRTNYDKNSEAIYIFKRTSPKPR